MSREAQWIAASQHQPRHLLATLNLNLNGDRALQTPQPDRALVRFATTTILTPEPQRCHARRSPSPRPNSSIACASKLQQSPSAKDRMAWTAWDVRAGLAAARGRVYALARQGTSSRLTSADACAHPFPLVSTPADSSAADADPSTLVAPSHPCSSFWTAAWPAGRRAEISSVWWRRHESLGRTRTRPTRREGWKDEARMGCEGERTSAARTGSEADESADASSASRTPH
ncbi:hypothetical protein BJ912DRAFT_87289 [Pholiota molesta]|nr:hypothetical protein BJ912DRAFT_87289 [Pholiota molesta]